MNDTNNMVCHDDGLVEFVVDLEYVLVEDLRQWSMIKGEVRFSEENC